MSKTNNKKSYKSPSITRYGGIYKVTQGSSNGNYLDQDFPAGTPFGALTFS